MKWLEELKESNRKYDDSVKSHTLTEVDEEAHVDMLFDNRDRLIAIVVGAEWRHTPDGRFCAICHSPHPDDFSGDGIIPDDHYKWEDLGHRPTCLYSDEWEGP